MLLSPDHAVFIEDVLIPIKHLVNNKTIIQEKVDQVTYLSCRARRARRLAGRGNAGESYLEDGHRSAFDNASDVVALHPNFGPRHREAFGCAPLVFIGAKLDAAIARANVRAPKDRRTARRSRLMA